MSSHAPRREPEVVEVQPVVGSIPELVRGDVDRDSNVDTRCESSSGNAIHHGSQCLLVGAQCR